MRFNDYIKIAEKDFAMLRKHAKRVKVLFNEDFSDMTFLKYDTLKHIVPNLVNSGEIEKAIFEIVKEKLPSIRFWRIRRLKNPVKLRFYFHVQDQYEAIAQIEKMHLYSPPSAEMTGAGISRLDILGDKNVIDALAKGNILRWEKIKQLPYDMVFDKLLMLKINREVNKRYNELMEEKRKNKTQ